MSITVTLGYDAISVNLSACPAGQRAGYISGSGGIEWTAAQFAANPGAICIDQSPYLSTIDYTADILDVENGAATVGDIAPWVKAARANFASGVRPGQREPLVYCADGTLDSALAALRAAGLSNVGFWMARPGIGLSTAEGQVTSATGAFPCIGVQYAWPSYGLPANASYDSSVFNTGWLTTQSGKAGSLIAIGSSGPAVVAAQKLLLALKYNIATDGLYGTGTQAAVRTFQSVHGLVPDGQVGPNTWTALNAAQVKPPVPPVTPPKPPVVTPPVVVKPPVAPPPLALKPVPTGLKQSAYAQVAAVNMAWTAVSGVTSYELQLERESGTTWTLVVTDTVHTNVASIGSLAHAVRYRWRVASLNAAGARNWSAWEVFTTP